jgi:hypoxanthine phosphoribosyltransferase
LASQPPLPHLRRVLHPDGVQFAHPAELAFARLLAYYRVRWVYEPTTFELRWNDEGRAIECFTPDFFLPDHRLYLELTTMRQPLVTRKNRKLRHLLELYPEARVRLLYRRDVQRLEDAYRRPLTAARGLRDVLWSETEIDRRVRLLASQIGDEWLGRPGVWGPPILLAIGSGAVRFQHALADALERRGIGVECDRLDPSRYRPHGAQSTARALRRPQLPLEGRRVLVLGDVVSSGLTLGWALERVRRQRADDVKSCALFDRASARILDLEPVWSGFPAPDVPLAGYGLSLHRLLRELPHVGPAATEQL